MKLIKFAKWLYVFSLNFHLRRSVRIANAEQARYMSLVIATAEQGANKQLAKEYADDVLEDVKARLQQLGV